MVWCEKWKPVILILFIYLGFSVVNLLFKAVLSKGANHLVLITYRQSASAVFLTPIACFLERKEEASLTTRILCYLFLSGLFGATLTQYLFLLGLQHTSAAFASAFFNMTPATTFLMALVFRQEKLNLKNKAGKAKVLGSVACLGGVLTLALYQGFPLIKPPHSPALINGAGDGDPKTSGKKSAENYMFGSIFLISSATVWSSWFIIQAEIGKIYTRKCSSTAFMSFFSAIQSAALCSAINCDLSVWLLKGKLQTVTVIVAGVVGSGLCYVGMSWCVEQRGPVFTAAFSPFMQIFVGILDLIFLHEEIYFGSLIGSITVVSGLYTILWGKSRELKEKVIKPDEALKEDNRTSCSSCTVQVDADSKCHLPAP
ncbi:hypothetical protein Dimus_025415 [Dionaea muscipula]